MEIKIHYKIMISTPTKKSVECFECGHIYTKIDDNLRDMDNSKEFDTQDEAIKILNKLPKLSRGKYQLYKIERGENITKK